MRVLRQTPDYKKRMAAHSAKYFLSEKGKAAKDRKGRQQQTPSGKRASRGYRLKFSNSPKGREYLRKWYASRYLRKVEARKFFRVLNALNNLKAERKTQ